MLISLANDMLPKMISYNSLFQILSSANPNYLPDLFCQIFLDTQVSLAPTHVIPSVRVIVQSVFLWLVCLLNFASLFLFAWGVRMRSVGGYLILHLPSWREPGATKIARNSFPPIHNSNFAFFSMPENEVVWLFQFSVWSESDPRCASQRLICVNKIRPLKQHLDLCQQMWF